MSKEMHYIKDICRAKSTAMQIIKYSTYIGHIAIVNSIICGAKKANCCPYRVANLLNRSEDYAERVLNWKKQDDFRIRTMRWEAA
ncbi:MAG: hypothetical protein HRT94_09885 [Alphaproteobacteria bacterium]|nr:hypothetical protein [Alphaproteobacteria bacterium]